MKHEEILNEISKWREEGLITEQQVEVLKAKYEPKEEVVETPRPQKASSQRMMMFYAAAIIILGTLSWINQSSNTTSYYLTYASLIFLNVAAFHFSYFLINRNLKVVKYLGNLLFIVSGIANSFILFYIDIKQKIFPNFTVFMLLSMMILLVVSYKLKQKALLGYSLFLSFVWFISQAQVAGFKTTQTIWGISFPVRLFLFSIILIALGYAHGTGINLFKKIDFAKFKLFKNVYNVYGLMILFISTWFGSLGQIMVQPKKYEIMVCVILVTLSALYAIYFGILKESKLFMYTGMAFLFLEVFGKLHQAVLKDMSKPIYLITAVVIVAVFGMGIEYILKHKDTIRKELVTHKIGA